MQRALVLLFSLGITLGYAQTYEPGKIDFSVSYGWRAIDSQALSLSESRSLFPNSVLLQEDFNGYGYPTNSLNASGMVNLMWGVRLKQNERFEQRFRVGITFSGSSPSYASFNKSSSFAFDTLTSSRTGQVTYVDSIYSENLSISTSQKQVGLDLAYLFKANHNGRWCFYSGIGVEIGALLDPEAFIYRSNYTFYTNNSGYFFPNIPYGTNEYQTEINQLDPGFYSLVYLPVGLDFRLSMKNMFWNRMHLFTEIRPSVSYSNSELSSQSVQFALGFAILGFRADF